MGVNMKLRRQIAMIVSLIMCFALFDIGIYTLFTKRCISNYSDGLKAKSIETDKYLPFEENSEIVKIDSEITLTGEIPVIDGAAALYPVYSAFVNAWYPEDSVSFENGDFSPESAMQYTNTRGVYKALAEGTADIGILAAPSEEQLAYAAEMGAELEFVPIGKEAFVFIVNSKNPVENLTSEQIRGIYSGKYHRWSELGGSNRLIGAIQRNKGSGSQTALINFMNGEPLKKDHDGFLGSSIGFSFRFYVEGIVGDNGVKMLSVDGVYPNAENITNGSYPIISEFYAVYRKDNKNENIPILIELMLSEDGQKIIEKSGYAPVKIFG